LNECREVRSRRERQAFVVDVDARVGLGRDDLSNRFGMCLTIRGSADHVQCDGLIPRLDVNAFGSHPGIQGAIRYANEGLAVTTTANAKIAARRKATGSPPG
jgi:hypothetical protein